MAQNIKGITIQLDGDATGLTKALKTIDAQTKSVQSELKQVDRLLKFDPSNVELLAQKQKLLGDAVNSTSKRLDALKQAQAEVERQFQAGEIGEEAYRKFQREIIATEGKLKSLQSQAEATKLKIDAQADTTGIDKMKSALKELPGAAKQAANEISNALATAGLAGSAAVGALVFGSDELNQSLARLKTNASTAGFTLEIVEEAFQNLSAVTGDSRAAVETVSNLMATGFSDQQLTAVLEEITGAYIAFSDTLSSEGIADGIQETFGVGEAAGSFLELLERMGVDIETFNAGLAKAKQTGQETDYVLQQLSELGLKSNYEEYQKLNPEVAKNAEATMNMQLALAELAIVLTPLVTMITGVVTKLVEWVNNNQTLATVLAVISGVITGISGAIMILTPIIGALIPIFAAISTAVAEAGGAMTLLRTVLGALTGPIGLVIAAITGIVTAFVIAYNKLEWFRDGVNEVWNKIKELTSAAFGAVKELITSLISSAVDFSKGILDKFSAFWNENGEFISSAVKLHFTTVKATIEVVMGVIQGIFQTVWSIISGVIKVAWETIQLVVESSLDIILGVISAVMKLIQGDWEGAWNDIKGIAENIMNNIIKFFQDINLKEIGMNIIQGLIDGIGSMVDAVKGVVEELASNLPGWVKKILGIKSPSRVMKELGVWTGQGLADGISATKNINKKVVEELGKLIIDTTKKNQAEVAKIADEAEKERTEVQREAAQKRTDLKKKDAKSFEKIERDSWEKLTKINEKAWSEMTEKQQQVDQEKLETIKAFLDEKRGLEQISLVDEVAIWEESLKHFKDGTDGKIEAQIAYRDALNAVNNEIVSINEQYSSKILQVNEDLKQREEELTKTYTQAVDDRAKSLMNFTGLFEEFDIKFATSGTKLLKNLQSQVDGFKTWQEEIEELSQKAIDEGLLEELRAMGPDALAEVMALNNMTDDELTKYSDLYKEKSQLAKNQAVSELESLRLSNEVTMKQLNADAAIKLSELETEWKTSLQAITGAAEEEFGSMYDIGVNAAKGLEDGLKSMEPSLMRQARSIARAIKDEIEDALDINSPSRVMRGIGIYVGQGLIEGMNATVSQVSKASAVLASSTTKGFSNSTSIDNSSRSTSTTQYGDINVTIPVRDLLEVKSVVDLLNRLPQAKRAFGN